MIDAIVVGGDDARGAIRPRALLAPMPSLALTGSLALVVISIGVFGSELSGSLRYEREAILAGQWWRLLTCHLVHPDPVHLLMNSLALFAWGYVCPGRMSLLEFWSTVVLSAAFIGMSVLVWSHGVEWMVGASAIIHALVATTSVKLAMSGRGLGVLGLLLLMVKIAGEQYTGASTWIGSLIAYPVVYDAHAYGVLAGVLVAVGGHLSSVYAPSIRQERAEG